MIANLIMSNHHDFNQPFGSPWKDKLSQLTTKDCCFKLKCPTPSRKHLHLIPQITLTGFRPRRSLRSRSLWNTRYQVLQLCTSNMLRALLLKPYDGYQTISVSRALLNATFIHTSMDCPCLNEGRRTYDHLSNYTFNTFHFPIQRQWNVWGFHLI